MNNLSKKWALTILEETENKLPSQLDKLLGKFFSILKKENKIYLAASIIKWVAKLEEQKARREGLRLIAAHDLTQISILKIAKIFKIAPEKITLKIEPRLLGGLVVEHHDALYDFSTKKHLEQLKTFLSV